MADLRKVSIYVLNLGNQIRSKNESDFNYLYLPEFRRFADEFQQYSPVSACGTGINRAKL